MQRLNLFPIFWSHTLNDLLQIERDLLLRAATYARIDNFFVFFISNWQKCSVRLVNKVIS